MSCITRAPLLGAHRRLTLVALQARLQILETRLAELNDLLPSWIPRGSERQRLKWCRQERTRCTKALKAVKRQIAAAGRAP